MTNLKLKKKNISLSGARSHESRIYFRAEIQKYFVRILVQVKTVEFAFNIIWPLLRSVTLQGLFMEQVSILILPSLPHGSAGSANEFAIKKFASTCVVMGFCEIVFHAAAF